MVALFTISNLTHFTLGVWIVDHHARFGNLVRNPMVWSTIAGFAFAIFHPPLPEIVAVTIKLVGDALIPMMLLSLGVRLTDVRLRDARLGVIGGVVCPVTGLVMAAAARAAARPRRLADRPPVPVRLPAAGRAQLHGRRAVQVRARQGRVDRAGRQPPVRSSSSRSASRSPCARNAMNHASTPSCSTSVAC
jgi:hypothetical protein